MSSLFTCRESSYHLSGFCDNLQQESGTKSVSMRNTSGLPFFSHGQLYVALSRVGNPANRKI